MKAGTAENEFKNEPIKVFVVEKHKLLVLKNRKKHKATCFQPNTSIRSKAPRDPNTKVWIAVIKKNIEQKWPQLKETVAKRRDRSSRSPNESNTLEKLD